MDKVPTTVFLRTTSGLVKSAGAADVFVYNIGVISIGIGVSLTHLTGPANYPGGSIPIASAIATLLMFFIALAFWFWSVAIPRSGGLYAYVTRGLNPALGFALSFVDAFAWLFYNALAATYITSIGFGPLLFNIGVFSNDAGLVRLAQEIVQPVPQFIIGTVAVVLAGILLITGMRKFFLFQKILFLIALIGIITSILFLFVRSNGEFVANFNTAMAPYIPNAYDTVIEAAKTKGWRFSGFNWEDTVKLAVWPILPLVGGIFSIAIGGEIREVKKSQGIGILGSIIVAGIVFVLVGHLSYRVFGTEFQGAVAFNSTADPTKSTPITPFFPLLAGILAGNVVGSVLISLGFLAWAYFWIPATLVYAERAVLAWSLDRLTPASFGYVSERFHTPVVAIVVTVILNIAFLYLFLFIPFFSTLTLVLAAMLAWTITMVAGILFPFRAKELYKRSGASGLDFQGFPLMSVANFLGLISVLILTYLLWNDPLAAGHSPQSLLTIGSVFGFGFAFFYIMKQRRKRQGIDIALAFKEIPVE